MSSIVESTTRAAVGVTVGVLVAVGVGTGALLHLVAVRARDETLTTALSAGVGAEPVDGTALTYRVVPVAELVGLPAAWVDEARRRERVVRGDLGEMRVVLGARDTEDDERPDHEHELLAALAPRVRWTESVGRFAAAWLAMTTLGAAVAARLQHHLVGRAVAPLARAVDEATHAARVGPSSRLTEDGPDEVRALLVAVNSLLGRLDAAYTSQTRFTAEAAHELRTPITALVGEVEVTLRRPRTAEELRDTLARLGDSARRLAALVEGLLLLARVDSGLAEDVREQRVLEDLVRAAVAQERDALEAGRVHLVAELPGAHVVRVHPPLLVAAIATLLRNVARHAGGCTAEVRVEAAEGMVAVTVDDDGPGVSADDRATAFDRFTRGGAARHQAPDGLGLGLPLARAVARAHGGECGWTPSRRGGCGVSVRIPLVPTGDGA